jgi:crotonobetainyl-CoA:carnitine CoA-transferase CaiB-like acyl-CoA transferase
VALNQLGYVASWYLNEGHMSTRQHRSAHYAVAPVQTFPTADGWLFVMCMTDRFWTELTDALGRPDLEEDARFASPASRQAHREALAEILDGEFRKHPNSHWLEVLGGVLPVAPVLDLGEALDNPFLRASGMIRDLPHPAKPGLRALANPIKIDGKRLDQVPCSPMGADNAAYLAGASIARGS